MYKQKATYKIGDKFNSWEIVGHVESQPPKWVTYVMARCKCGDVHKRVLTILKTGRSKQCAICSGARRSYGVKGQGKNKSESLIARENGDCRKDGECRFYSRCSNVEWKYDCRGYEPSKTYYTNGNSTVIHGGVL